MAKRQRAEKTVEALKHEDAKRKNIPTAEYQSVLQKNEENPILAAFERRNKDLDPQLVWRGKDMKDWSDLVVHAPPLYIQEKVHPKALIDDLLRQSKEQDYQSGKIMADLFSDFNGIPKEVDKTEFYQHDQNWSNRMILGDSLQVMASLTEREGLRGKVQCIYFDPPYGIKFNSNFQWSTTSRTVTDGKIEHITREPEQVKAFRDTWRDGVNSYLTYLRDRLMVARDLLTESGSIFVQIGDENLHRVRSVMDEIFGDQNYCATIVFQKSGGSTDIGVELITDYLLWYNRDKTNRKIRRILASKDESKNFERDYRYFESEDGEIVTAGEKNGNDDQNKKYRRFRLAPCNSQHFSKTRTKNISFEGNSYHPGADRQWSVDPERLELIGVMTNRLLGRKQSLYYKLFNLEAPGDALRNVWMDTAMAGLTAEKLFVVQTSPKVIQRCILMTSDPGDIVLDPTCGSGTTAYVAEQWGRKWITIDTSRVALALARSRIMGARYPYYLLTDSKEGQIKYTELTGKTISMPAPRGDIRQGFLCERVPHVTLKSIADNTEIDVIWHKWQATVQPLIDQINKLLKQNLQEWEILKQFRETWPPELKDLHAKLKQAIIARQKKIDESIVAKADIEYVYDKPYEERNKVRVAGPFTVESLSPHRILGVDENDELVDPLKLGKSNKNSHTEFAQMVVDNLRMAGVQQSKKDDKINFTSVTPWPGDLICGEGRYLEGGMEKRAAIFVGPEFGTVQRVDLVSAAREAADASFDLLIACAFNYEAHTTEFNKLGKLPVLKARMNADLHMSDDLKNTGKGNLFVIFGEPEIEVISAKNNNIQVSIKGIYVFDPTTGEVRSDDPDGIACWFIDTDYNEESFFVRHAYFLGANDPYSSLKTSLKAEINKETWETLHSDISRPFAKPKSGRIAVKAINHLGDEVMKVFKID